MDTMPTFTPAFAPPPPRTAIDIRFPSDWTFVVLAFLIVLCLAVGLSTSAGCQVQPLDVPESRITPAPDGSDSPLPFRPTAIQFRLHELQTVERRMQRLPPQSLDAELCRKASQWAEHMAASNSLRHSSLPVHENIGCGQRSPEEIIGDWMGSPGHRANLLSRSPIDAVGFGYAVASDGRQYWCSMHAESEYIGPGPSPGPGPDRNRRRVRSTIRPNKPDPIVRG